jgi:hypothetical protein
MTRQQVESGLIKSLEYDAERRVLTVEFNRGGVYEYEDFPPTEWANFDKADSKGKFFHAYVKGQYQYRKQAEETAADG